MKNFKFHPPAGGSNVKSIRGVTLIELLIVIGIIAVLASVMLFYINPLTQFQKGRDTRRKADLAQIQAAIEFYRTDKAFYPLTSNLPACGGSFTSGGAQPTIYVQKMPCDPFDNVAYVYNPAPSGCNNTTTNCTTYTLVACLEIITDPARDLPTNSNPPCNGTTRWSKTVINP